MPADGKLPPDEKSETKDWLAVWRRVRCHSLHVARRRGFPGAKQEVNKLNTQEARKPDSRMLVTLALLVAMEVVLARFLGIQTPIVQIKLSFIPVVMAALLYGPVPAALAAALGDFIGAVLFPSGAYFPGFTLTAALGGLVYGLVLYRKPASLWRSCLAVGIITIVLNLGLNTFWLWMITKDGYLGLLAARFPKYFITVPVQIAVIRLLTGRVGQAVRRIALT